MKRPAALALALAGALGLAACATGRGRTPLPTVPQVDLDRYAGRWFEIASYPAFFQRGCTGTTAEYRPLPDGGIAVANRCWKEGREVRVEGVARVVPGSGNARLKVRIGPAPFAGDYYVIGLDTRDYRWAVVGHPSRNYLWILAREPRLDPARYPELVALAQRLGYDPARIRPTDQSPNLDRRPQVAGPVR